MKKMAMIEKKKDEIEEKKEEKIRYRAYPDISTYVDYNKRLVKVEIILPGVNKENISLKALPAWFFIDATRGEIQYTANHSWGAEIVPNKTEAIYNNGLLKITAHIKDPLDGAKVVTF
jgi:HSP20 family molecular chaperone IbpA